MSNHSHYNSELVNEMIQAATAAAYPVLSQGLKHEAPSLGNFAAQMVISSPNIIEKPVGYACKVAVNAAKRLSAKENKFESFGEGREELPTTSEFSVQAWEANNLRRALPEAFAVVQSAVRELPDLDRLAVVGVSVGKVNFKLLGLMLNCTPEAAKKRWARALVRLHEQITDGINGSPLLRELFESVIEDDGELFRIFVAAALEPGALLNQLDRISGGAKV